MKILIVGGGTAGLICALILKKRFNYQVDVVHSSKIGIIGVGEGSTEHFAEFMKFIGIDRDEIIKECNATYKSGIMFDGWNESRKYLHYISPPFLNQYGQYSHVFARQISNNDTYNSPNYLWNNKINVYGLQDKFIFNQFHFDTHKLNSFLINKAKGMSINFYDDEIYKINIDASGEIDSIVGNKKIYNYDFYIDSTGFKKILIEKLGGKWVSFSKFLKMKSAIVFPTEDEDEYNIWTLSKAMDYGWMFKIPTWGRHGNGYIFDSEYISADEAKKEIDILLSRDVEISKIFNFDPGHINKAWIKNCVAIGLSSSFVEPLEATSIGTSIQQSFMLMHKISNYSERDIESYNSSFTDIMNNIRDFIALHYLTNKNNTDFWIDVKNSKIPDSLYNNLEVWKNRMPILEDFKGQSQYLLFFELNFISIMQGLDLFDKNMIKKELLSLNNYILSNADRNIEEIKYFDKHSATMSHKKFIEIIRNGN